MCFAPDLIEAYPEAKVILVEREIEAWYKSYFDIIISHTFHSLANPVALLEPEIAQPTVISSHTTTQAYFQALRSRLRAYNSGNHVKCSRRRAGSGEKESLKI